MHRLLIYIVIIILFSGCCRRYSEHELYRSALEYAGENAPELEKVIHYYQDDDFKKRCAEFLIGNTQFKRYYPSTKEKKQIENLLGKVANTEGLWYFSDISPDFPANAYPSPPISLLDVETLDSSFLINHMDSAFSRLEKAPWNVDLPEDEFKELLLPYRLGNEEPTLWRSVYYNHYYPLIQKAGLDTSEDVLEVAEFVWEILNEEDFKYNICALWPHRDALSLFKNPAGPCRDQSDRIIYVLRSLGIPSAKETYFASPETLSSHQWVTVRDNKTGKFIPFGKEMKIQREKFTGDGKKKAKVYRFAHGIQKERVENFPHIKNQPQLFSNYFIKDVTANYFGENSIEVKIENKDNSPVYLGVFSPSEWIAIDRAAKNTKNNAVFRNIEPNNIYAPIIYDSERKKTNLCGYPFRIDDNMQVRYFIPETTKKEEVNLATKMPLMPWLGEWAYEGIVGGRFRLYDNNFQMVYESLPFNDTLPSNLNYIHLPPVKARYLEYSVPDTIEMSIGEIMVYKDSVFEKPLKLNCITEMDYRHHPERITDDDRVSFFLGLEDVHTILWDMDEEEIPECIVFMPRNNDNWIWKGEHYELCYFESPQTGWKSLGKKRAERHASLRYDNVPSNSLLWLRNLDHGKEEEVFFMDKNRQVFSHDL